MRTHRPRPAPVRRSAFAGFRFPPDVIVLAVRWYLRFGLSYRDVGPTSLAPSLAPGVCWHATASTIPGCQGHGRPPGQTIPGGQDHDRGRTMTEASVSFAGNLTDHPEVRYTQSGIARAVFRVAVSGRREQAASCPRGSLGAVAATLAWVARAAA